MRKYLCAALRWLADLARDFARAYCDIHNERKYYVNDEPEINGGSGESAAPEAGTTGPQAEMPTPPVPIIKGLAIGRVVHYVYSEGDVPKRPDAVGTEAPAVIVQVWDNEHNPVNGCVNLLVLADGTNDTGDADRGNVLWLTSRTFSETPEPGKWHWPEIDRSTVGCAVGPTATPKTLDNVGTEQTTTPGDMVKWGDPDTWQLICKASSECEGWMKSTKAMAIPGGGVLVQVTTQQRNPDGSYAVAEAIAHLPNCRVIEQVADDGFTVIGRHIEG